MVDEEYVKKLFVASIVNEITKDRGDSVHVSSMVYECPRLLAYMLEEKVETIEKANADNVELGDVEDSLYRIWIGTKLHETPLTEMHEKKYVSEYKGYKVSGTIDEILDVDGKRYILDKKFVAKLPSAMYEHHRNQVMFYSVLMRDVDGIKADGIILLYFKPMLSAYGEERMKVFIEDISEKDIDMYKEKMLDILDGIKERRAKRSWYCQYCAFYDRCKLEGGV
jgi:CRISPR/Cas system-associated exonuclease Cas4 (RecB family)